MANLISIYLTHLLNDNLLQFLFLWSLIVCYLLDMCRRLTLWSKHDGSWIRPLIPTYVSSPIFKIQGLFKFQVLSEHFCLIIKFSLLFCWWFRQQSRAVNQYQKFLQKLSFFLNSKYHLVIFLILHLHLHPFYLLVIKKFY